VLEPLEPFEPEVLPSFLALFECDPVGVSAFLFTAIDVLVVEEAVAVVVVAVDEADFVVVMGFIVAETGFTGAISTFSGVLSEVLLVNPVVAFSPILESKATNVWVVVGIEGG